MAFHIINTSNIVSVGNAYNLGVNDYLYLTANTILGTQDSLGDGIYDSGNAYVEIHGTVIGMHDGIDISGTAAGTSTVIVGGDGTVTSPGVAIYVGLGSHNILNRGQVSGSAKGIYTLGAGSTVNYGSISATNIGIFDGDTQAGDTSATFNYGSIVGSFEAYEGAGSATEQFGNSGTIVGGMFFNSAANDLVYNSGSIDLAASKLDFGSGANDGLSNSGSITTTDPFFAIQFGNGANDWFYNAGTVNEVGTTSSSETISFGSGASNILINDIAGLIHGNVFLGGGNNQAVVNSGRIVGDVHLGGGGSQMFDGRNGTITGTIYAGTGSGDAIYAGFDNETLHKAAGGNSTFYAGAGLDTLIAPISSFQLNQIDVVNNFKVFDGVHGTLLDLPTGSKSAAQFLSYNGGTMIGVPVSGGWSDIFIAGVAPSQVQTQTSFIA